MVTRYQTPVFFIVRDFQPMLNGLYPLGKERIIQMTMFSIDFVLGKDNELAKNVSMHSKILSSVSYYYVWL